MKRKTQSLVKSGSLFSTKSGVRIKELRLNAILGVWFGTVSGELNAWYKNGKCLDRARPELDLLISLPFRPFLA